MQIHKDSSNKSVKLWVVLVFISIILVAGGYFGYKYYEDYMTNKIYSVDETVKLSDFSIEITKATFKPVNLPIDKKTVEKYGDISQQEDCEKLSKTDSWVSIMRNGEWSQYGPSAFNICHRRNDSRNEINKYSNSNSQLAVDYKITALSNVDTSKLKINLTPDSGRKLGEQVDSLSANQFFEDGAQEILDFDFGVPGPVYTEESRQTYKPYFASDMGGDLNKGLSRKGYTYTDIRKSENSVDLKISYTKNGQKEVRVVRITR